MIRNSDIRDNDPHVIAWLSAHSSAQIESVDLNKLELNNTPSTTFDVVVVSEVFNYVDYKKLIAHIYALLQPNGLIFVNNVIDYGLPPLFSDRRPSSLEEVRRSIENTGFKILEEDSIPSKAPKNQKEPRLTLVAQK